MNDIDVRLVGNGETKIVTWTQACLAQEETGLELILIADATAEQPPVYKLIDQGKEDYLKKRKCRSKGKAIVVKEVEFKAAIAEADFTRKVSQVEKFLERGIHVNAKVVATRDRSSKALAHRVVSFIEALPVHIKAYVPDTIVPGSRSVIIALTTK